jgi:hypothetical protein
MIALNMHVNKMLKRLLQIAAVLLLLSAATAAGAATSAASEESLSVLDYLTDKDGRYTGPTVEDNVALMDSDKNGFADVFEVRAFLQLKHGNDYQKELLDNWEASASGKSCSSPFAKELYSDKSY